MNQQPGALDHQGDYQLSENYGAAEYDALKQRCGLVDLTQDRLLSLRGGDALSFLQGMVTQNLHAMPVGTAKPSLMLDSAGKILAKLNLYHLEDKHLVIECPFEQRDNIQAILGRYIIMEDVTLAPLNDFYFFSLQGCEAAIHHEALAKIYPHWHFINHDRCGFGGWDVLCRKEEAGDAITALIDMGLIPIGYNALNAARIAALIAWFGVEMQPGQNPLTCGIGGIAFDKGCYIGQETVAKTHDRGHPPQLLCLVQAEDDREIGQLPRPLLSNDKQVATLTSLARHPEDNHLIGLALVKYQPATQAAVLQDAAGTSFRVTQTVTHKV